MPVREIEECSMEDFRDDPEEHCRVLQSYRNKYPNDVIKVEMRHYELTLVRKTMETEEELQSRKELQRLQGLRNLGLF